MTSQERKAARQARRAARRAARQGRQDARGDRKANRQKNRQGFLSGIIGDDGLGGLIEKSGDVFGGGGYDTPPTKTGGEGTDKGMDTTTLALIGLGAYFLMKKK